MHKRLLMKVLDRVQVRVLVKFGNFNRSWFVRPGPTNTTVIAERLHNMHAVINQQVMF